MRIRCPVTAQRRLHRQVDRHAGVAADTDGQFAHQRHRPARTIGGDLQGQDQLVLVADAQEAILAKDLRAWPDRRHAGHVLRA